MNENRDCQVFIRDLEKYERGILFNFLRFLHVNNQVIVFPLTSARSHELLSDKITHARVRLLVLEDKDTVMLNIFKFLDTLLKRFCRSWV